MHDGSSAIAGQFKDLLGIIDRTDPQPGRPTPIHSTQPLQTIHPYQSHHIAPLQPHTLVLITCISQPVRQSQRTTQYLRPRQDPRGVGERVDLCRAIRGDPRSRNCTVQRCMRGGEGSFGEEEGEDGLTWERGRRMGGGVDCRGWGHSWEIVLE